MQAKLVSAPGAPHFQAMLQQLEPLTAERAPDGKPFSAEALTMLTDRA